MVPSRAVPVQPECSGSCAYIHISDIEGQGSFPNVTEPQMGVL